MLARQHGATLVEAIALAAIAAIEPDRTSPARHRALRLPDLATHPIIAKLAPEQTPGGAASGRRAGDDPRAGVPIATTGIAVRCLGGFELLVEGEPVDLAPLRPRARAVLHVLATHAPKPVHRDVLLAALWSDSDTESGIRSLQVAVSAIRKQLEKAGWANGIERSGDGYALAIAPADSTDVLILRRTVEAARRAHSADDRAGLVQAATHVLEIYRGDLLPEEGAADWVVATRDTLRLAASATTRLASSAALADGDTAAALALAQRGLQLDRFDDAMWNVVIDAHTARGETGAAQRARRDYEAVLAELGVTSPAGTPAP
jgi:DNA-binding SARP family transcriptional activator